MTRRARTPRGPTISADRDLSEARQRRLLWDLRQQPHARPNEPLNQLLLPKDASAARKCGSGIVRLSHTGTPDHHYLTATRCNTIWCPRCTHINHQRRIGYTTRKLSTVRPDEDGGPDAGPKIAHLVFTVPPSFRELLRDHPHLINTIRRAATNTILDAYRIQGVHRRRRSLGIIHHLHPWGDTARPWPKWAPHLDTLLNAYRLEDDKTTLTPLPKKWPLRYWCKRDQNPPLCLRGDRPCTRHLYTRNVRQELSQTLPNGLAITDWQTLVVHVVQGRDGLFREGGHAAHMIAYSTRPHWHPGRARVRGPMMEYRPQGSRVVHRRLANEALADVYQLQRHLEGGEHHAYAGYLAKRSYTTICRRRGIQPATWKPKGWHLEKMYWP